MMTGGLFDLQVNGYAGVDFNDPDITAQSLDHALDAMLAHGVTGCLPTLITASPDQLAERFRALDAAVTASRSGPSMIPGYHLEGPFLNDSVGYRGCHPASVMTDPMPELIDDLAAGLKRPILLVTLAPERENGVQAIRRITAAGRIVAIGHSSAGYDTIEQAATAGATLSTHLGNGLPPQLPKLENTLLAQLAEPRLSACLIADGHHMSAQALAALIRLKGADRCLLVTDAVMAAAAGPGRYRLAGMDVMLDEHGKVTGVGSPGLAGSALRLDQAVRNVVGWRITTPEQATVMAGDRPRAAIQYALQHHGLAIDAGRIQWNSALEPKLLKRGGVSQ